jgi:hypothetical protein
MVPILGGRGTRIAVGGVRPSARLQAERLGQQVVVPRRLRLAAGASEQFFSQDGHVGRGLDGDTDRARLDGRNVDSDVEAGEDDLLVQTAR